MARKPHVLTINGGSSSVKFAVYAMSDPPERRLHGSVDRIGTSEAKFIVDDASAGRPESRDLGNIGQEQAADFLIDWLDQHVGLASIDAFGHRVATGGVNYVDPQRVTDDLVEELRRISAFAPEHLPFEIALIERFRARIPDRPHVVCFDTTFHRDLPPVARILPIPRRLHAKGIARFGFHGLSYAYLMETLAREAGPEAAQGRVILAHLGNGASLAAVHRGKSIDTTMAFTPASGVPMSRRSGDLDPGLVGYLAHTEGMTAEAFNDMVNRQSGLLGVSETSGDVRDLLAREALDPRAGDALAMFCYEVKKRIGAFAAALGGLDVLVFAGGIGENASAIRGRICERLDFLGIELDAARNAASERVISSASSRVGVRVMRTNEEVMIAKAVAQVLGMPGCDPANEEEAMRAAEPPQGANSTPAGGSAAAQPQAWGEHASEAISPELLTRMNAYWRAANYLTVGQIYLIDNPLLRRPLTLADIKPRLLGHWGTTPGLNFLYVHLNRVIRQLDLDMIFITGPGHGGPGIVANTYLEGTYSELYPDVSRDEAGLKRLFTQFSFPGGIPSHTAAETPGSINEGGELGYSLTHAYGAAFDNPGLIVACVVGDGEAETGPLAASWHSNKFLDPAGDGAVLPILHLNGYKIANPTLLARIPHRELDALFRGYGYKPHFVEGDDPATMHRLMAATLDRVIEEIREIQFLARREGFRQRPTWPMIILRSPKGWTGPKEVDGLQIEGTWRSHQVPIGDLANPAHLQILEAWMRSYRPGELFDDDGALDAELAALAPEGNRRMGANPHANGGLLLKALRLPDVRDRAVAVPEPGGVDAEATRVGGALLRDVMSLNAEARNFRVVGPDETTSNRLDALFEVTNRTWIAERLPGDDHLAHDGRVMEVLSEHLCEGWLEGYLLTGRHGLFNCYEAFVHIVDSMFNQHAKWLKVSRNIPWRRPIASLNYLLSSHVWRQDHNGFSHQDPGFIDLVMNKKAETVRVYLPPDANTLLCVLDGCLRSRNLVNVVVAGKNAQPQWLDIDAAIRHCAAGIGIWEWASSDRGDAPDLVMACAGDVPTIETLAAVDVLRRLAPDLRVRVVNVVDLMTLQPSEEHPHGLPDRDFDEIFTADKPVIFAYHGYPWLIHRLTYRRTNHDNLHVRGYKEEGTTTTPFDMVVLNDLDRFHLVMDAADRVPALRERAAYLKQQMRDKRTEHRQYIVRHGEDMPEIRNWKWPHGAGA